MSPELQLLQIRVRYVLGFAFNCVTIAITRDTRALRRAGVALPLDQEAWDDQLRVQCQFAADMVEQLDDGRRSHWSPASVASSFWRRSAMNAGASLIVSAPIIAFGQKCLEAGKQSVVSEPLDHQGTALPIPVSVPQLVARCCPALQRCSTHSHQYYRRQDSE